MILLGFLLGFPAGSVYAAFWRRWRSRAAVGPCDGCGKALMSWIPGRPVLIVWRHESDVQLGEMTRTYHAACDPEPIEWPS
jgi:hypothetical protein